MFDFIFKTGEHGSLAYIWIEMHSLLLFRNQKKIMRGYDVFAHAIWHAIQSNM